MDPILDTIVSYIPAPNVDLEEIERKDRIRALERKDVVIGTNSISFSKDISARMRKRQVTDFRRACNAAMKEGKMEEARRLARENPELLKEAQEAIEEEQKRLEKEKAGLAGLLKDDGEAR